jgi:hypothetical protein
MIRKFPSTQHYRQNVTLFHETLPLNWPDTIQLFSLTSIRRNTQYTGYGIKKAGLLGRISSASLENKFPQILCTGIQ